MLKVANISLGVLPLIEWIKLNLVADDDSVMEMLAQSYPPGKVENSLMVLITNHLLCDL